MALQPIAPRHRTAPSATAETACSFQLANTVWDGTAAGSNTIPQREEGSNRPVPVTV